MVLCIGQSQLTSIDLILRTGFEPVDYSISFNSQVKENGKTLYLLCEQRRGIYVVKMIIFLFGYMQISFHEKINLLS